MDTSKIKYANIPGKILYDKRIAPTARDTYCQIRGLAWGKTETPPVTMKELEEATGKHQSTLYEHMRLLRHVGALLWRSASNSTFIFSFEPIDGPGNSENSESLNSKRIVVKTLRVKKLLTKADSEFSELKPAASKARRRKLGHYTE